MNRFGFNFRKKKNIFKKTREIRLIEFLQEKKWLKFDTHVNKTSVHGSFFVQIVKICHVLNSDSIEKLNL